MVNRLNCPALEALLLFEESFFEESGTCLCMEEGKVDDELLVVVIGSAQDAGLPQVTKVVHLLNVKYFKIF
jgi:hypothetical protein